MRKNKGRRGGDHSPHLSPREASLASAARSFAASLSLSWWKSSLSCKASRRRASQPTERAWSVDSRSNATRNPCRSAERVLFVSSARSLLRSAWLKRYNIIEETIIAPGFHTSWESNMTFSSTAFSFDSSASLSSMASAFVLLPACSTACRRVDVLMLYSADSQADSCMGNAPAPSEHTLRVAATRLAQPLSTINLDRRSRVGRRTSAENQAAL